MVTSMAVYPWDSGHENRRDMAFGFGFIGIATFIAGVITAATARGHLYDAVNIYNDGLAADNRNP